MRTARKSKLPVQKFDLESSDDLARCNYNLARSVTKADSRAAAEPEQVCLVVDGTGLIKSN